MSGSIFIGQLRQSWQQILTWGGGLASLMFFVGAIIQDSAVLDGYANMMRMMPPAFLAAFGVSDPAILTTPEGFLGFAGFTYGSIILAVYGVLAGLNITANDEDSGVMNILLSLPIARWQVIVERFLAHIVLVTGILLMMFFGIVLGSWVFEVGIDYMTLFLGTINLLPAVLTIIAATAFITSVIANKLIATGLAAALVAISYFLNVIVDLVDSESLTWLTWLGKLSIFNYLKSEQVLLTKSLSYGNIAMLTGVTVALIMLAMAAFQSRDISG